MKKIILIFQVLLLTTVNSFAHSLYPEPAEDKEEILDIIADIVFIAADVGEIIATGGTSGWVSLAADVGCAFTPGATGGGMIYRSGKGVTQGAKTIKNVRVSRRALRGANKFSGSFKLTREFVEANIGHALNKHGLGRVHSYFTGVKNKKDMIKILEDALSKAHKGNSTLYVRPDGAFSMMVDVGKKVGLTSTSKNGLPWLQTSYVMIHYTPNSRAHKFSMYPCDLLAGQRIKPQF